MDMCHAMNEIEKQKELKVVVITGAGDAFCGGMDLEKFFLEPAQAGPKVFSDTMDIFFEWIGKVKNSKAVTVASINGYTFGGGLELVGVCDLAIAAEDAIMGISEVNFGLLPGGGTLWAIVNNFNNRKQALYYSLTGKTFTGKEAVEMGYIDHAVPKEKLAEETEKLVANLVNKNRVTLTSIKQAFEAILHMDFEKAIDYEMAKVHEMTYLQGDDSWLNRALVQFRDREYKPGLESYKTKK